MKYPQKLFEIIDNRVQMSYELPLIQMLYLIECMKQICRLIQLRAGLKYKNTKKYFSIKVGGVKYPTFHYHFFLFFIFDVFPYIACLFLDLDLGSQFSFFVSLFSPSGGGGVASQQEAGGGERRGCVSLRPAQITMTVRCTLNSTEHSPLRVICKKYNCFN